MTRLTSGRYKDRLLANVPTGYLKWMVFAEHTYAVQAAAELERRKGLAKLGGWIEPG